MPGRNVRSSVLDATTPDAAAPVHVEQYTERSTKQHIVRLLEHSTATNRTLGFRLHDAQFREVARHPICAVLSAGGDEQLQVAHIKL